MNFPRKKIKWTNKKDISFLCVDWIECDEPIYDNEEKPDDYYEQTDKIHNKFYTIFVFGVTEEGYSVCLKIKNYNPYFYVKIPDILLSDKKLKNIFIDEFISKTNILKYCRRGY